MKNIEKWVPTKFVFRRGKFRASHDEREVGAGSRLAADHTARAYHMKVGQYANGHLLDLGCGKVPFYHLYKKHVNEITCVDWGNTDHDNSHLDFEMDLNQKLELPDNTYTTIVISSVLEHIAEPQLLMNEMARVLADGGVVLLNVPFYYSLHAEPHDYFRYTRFALEHMSVKAGFTVLGLEAYAGAPEVVVDIMSKLMVKLPLFGRPIAKLMQAVTWHLISDGPGRKLSLKTANKFPLGYFLTLTK